jgi:hypothetical protein
VQRWSGGGGGAALEDDAEPLEAEEGLRCWGVAGGAGTRVAESDCGCDPLVSEGLDHGCA